MGRTAHRVTSAWGGWGRVNSNVFLFSTGNINRLSFWQLSTVYCLLKTVLSPRHFPTTHCQPRPLIVILVTTRILHPPKLPYRRINNPNHQSSPPRHCHRSSIFLYCINQISGRISASTAEMRLKIPIVLICFQINQYRDNQENPFSSYWKL